MPLQNPGAWGPLRDRYQGARPRRMLALDGGGIRGLLTVQVLKEIERKLAEHTGMGDEFRLCQYFDYVGGTSTGAIIAAAIARGLSMSEIEHFYQAFGEQVFVRRRWGIWDSLYKDGPLEGKLREVYGTQTKLGPDDLKCLLLVVARNATTDSVWPISSNPDAHYNQPDRADCNLHIPLWQLVRASTAAPVYFPAEVINWDADDPGKSFVFVDGGTSAYNNPAFLMARMATEPAYKLGWKRGERDLLVVSLGTGSAPAAGNGPEDPDSNLVSSAAATLSALMRQAAYDQDANCRTMGRASYGPPLDREVGDLVPRASNGEPLPLAQDLGRAFTYVRYDADLSPAGLEQMGLPGMDADEVQKLDGVDSMDDLVKIGRKVAQEVDLFHFGTFV